MPFQWSGRVDERAKGKRIHQVVEVKTIEELETSKTRAFGIVGFECEEGVRRNKGRLGAAKAPNVIRKQMGSIPYHANKENLVDIGNVVCAGDRLEEAQEELGNHVAALIKHNYTPIILGGGHETFYGHYLGVRKALGLNKKIGLINLDAHFDLRVDDVPSSGTMFRQILESDDNASYLCVGLQKLGNTEQLFETAEQYGVEYIYETEIAPLKETFSTISKFAAQHDAVIYTICTDVINQAFAPGVSAPAPFGLHPDTVRAITKHVVGQENFLSFDVSEVNPLLDVADKTSRLMGYVIAEVLTHLNKETIK